MAHCQFELGVEAISLCYNHWISLLFAATLGPFWRRDGRVNQSVPDVQISMVGFGEAARAFVSGWQQAVPLAIRAFDIKSAAVAGRQELLRAYAESGVQGLDTLALALSGATLVFCLVPADQALAATRAAAGNLEPGALYLDGNSCSPGTKRQAAELIASVGGHYVDMAIMAPVKPLLHRTPVLLSGKFAAEAASRLAQLDMQPSVAGSQIGDASSIKMLRSVMIKGLEALTAECLLAARRAGVEERVLASLQASDPQVDWAGRGAYNLERMRVHGARRAAEMREVANTLQELGLPSHMAAAAALWQDELAAVGAGSSELNDSLDEILAARE